jgi:hypothetical protein
MTWELEVDYAKIASVPVKRLVAKHASLAPKRVSRNIPADGVEYPAIGDSDAHSWLRGSGFVGETWRQNRKGATSGHTKTDREGDCLCLCSLAHNGQPLKQVRQFADGCVFEAVLPSDMWSFEGGIFVAINRDHLGTKVIAATHDK